MRFFLLARARSGGLIRLLSERAYDSRSAAVDAASATASAGGIDLRDDEVLAVDLDGAGPVLVLRVNAPLAAAQAPAAPAYPQITGVACADVFPPAASSVSSSTTSSATDGASECRDAGTEPAVRLQPRFPLFGAQDDASEEDLAESLRRVARRMEQDLTLTEHTEWTAADDIWDAHTLDDYALPDDAHISSAREEGRLRIDAAERLRDDTASWPCDDESRGATGPDEVRESGYEGDTPQESWGDDQAAPATADDPAPDMPPAYPDDVLDRVALDESVTAERVSLADGDPKRTRWAESEADAFWSEASQESEATASDDEPERDGVAPEPEPEPRSAPYRPAILDFAMWVCADCVYQRTCRKAGVASPATCGNFQWRSF